MSISMITCINEDGALTCKGKPIYESSSYNMKLLELTKDNIVIMGRNKFEYISQTLPELLKQCTPVVITTDKDYKDKVPYGVIVFHDTPAIIKQSLNGVSRDDKHIHVIGGSEIYKQFINYVDTIHIMLIHEKDKSFDTCFPMNKLEAFEIDNCIKCEGIVDFSNITYKRKKETT